MNLGAHMGTSGGLHTAFERAEKTTSHVIQIFVKSNTRWSAPPLKEEEIVDFRKARKGVEVSFVMAHSGYLINLASPTPEGKEKSMDSFINEMERCHRLGVPWLNIHPGSHLGEGEATGIKRVSAALDEAFKKADAENVGILLETTAGQGTNLGHTFGQLAEIIERCRHGKRLGVCLDTCHVFAAGYNLSTEEGYETAFEEFDRLIGLDRLVAFHMNDSKHPFGSRKDRHDHIGKGFLGESAFKRLVRDPRFRKIPMILETPKGESRKDIKDEFTLDIENLKKLRELRDS